ncbi:MAG: LysM peptidoglycan-binding domain-containing protein [Lachnospiraceae bacterium]|nr:LysM peptidoglycan-binding domain-containing protein [Lachnospiraceae bacterium]
MFKNGAGEGTGVLNVFYHGKRMMKARISAIMKEDKKWDFLAYCGIGIMAEDEAGAEEYVVKKGDTLWKIAEEMLGSSFRYAEIYELNKATIEETAQNKGKEDTGDGYWIFQGTLLRMPEQ